MKFTSVELVAQSLSLCRRRPQQASYRELRPGEFNPSHGELGRRSARCAWAGSTHDAVSGTRASSAPTAVS
jgi:hypothetical protein